MYKGKKYNNPISDLISGYKTNENHIVDSTNDLEMIEEGLRKNILTKDQSIFKKTNEEKQQLAKFKSEHKKNGKQLNNIHQKKHITNIVGSTLLSMKNQKKHIRMNIKDNSIKVL